MLQQYTTETDDDDATLYQIKKTLISLIVIILSYDLVGKRDPIHLRLITSEIIHRYARSGDITNHLLFGVIEQKTSLD